MEAKDFRNVILYLLNKWSTEEASIIFNNTETFDYDTWKFSLGWHIWNKWLEYAEEYGQIAACSYLILNIDNNCLQKLIDRSIEYYK